MSLKRARHGPFRMTTTTRLDSAHTSPSSPATDAPSSLGPSAPAKLDYIDGLRGLAILGVLFTHSGQSIPGLSPIWYRATEYGAYGVQLFFMVSAFTLFLSLARRGEGATREHRAFYARRFFRIMPLYILALACYAAREIRGGASVTGLQLLACATFLNGLSPAWINSLPPGGWSVTDEVYSYLLIPWLFGRMKSIGRAVLFLLAAVVVAVSLHAILAGEAFTNLMTPLLGRHVNADPLWSNHYLYFWFPNQLPVFLAGMLAYLIHRDAGPRLRATPAAGLLLSVALATAAITLFFPPPLLVRHLAFSAGLLALLISASLRPWRFLTAWPMRYLGVVSFSVYLVHFFVWHIVDRAWPAVSRHLPAAPTALLLGYFVVLTVGSTIAATLTYRCIEAPGIAMGRWVVRRLRG